jgi:serine/threonine protein kinase
MNNLLGMEIDSYTLRELVRHNEYTAIYKAYHQSLGRFVTMKVTRLHHAQSAPHRFSSLAQAVMQCKHQNIVPVYEYGQHEQFCYFTMQYIEQGHLLSQRRSQPLPPLDVVKLGKHLLAGLSYAHKRGVLHCDIHPETILIADKNWPMLLDFALSKSLDQAHSKATDEKQTRVYSAPEALAGQPLDQRSDLYALAAVLYELLTGRLPKQGALIPLSLGFGIASPLKQRGLAKALGNLLQLALNRDPSERFQSAQAMAKALDQLELAWRKEQEPQPRPRLGVSELYHEGVKAIATEQWGYAIECLQQVVMLRPSYKDAFDLLTVARERLECAHIDQSGRKSATRKVLFAIK